MCQLVIKIVVFTHLSQLFNPCGKYLDLRFSRGPHFVWSICQNCGWNDLSCVNWLLRS